MKKQAYSVLKYFKKSDLKISLSVFLSLVAFINILANTYSQNTKISLDLKEVSIEKVLTEIEALTAYNFLYNDDEIDFSRIVTVRVKNKELSKILLELFAGDNISYTIIDKQIILKPQAEKLKTHTDHQVVQQLKVTGKVTDEKGRLLPGVNIVIKGTTTGTQTDFNGNYSITAKKGDTLQFSFIGMKTKDIIVGTYEIYDIVMEEDAAALEEIVVVGYGTSLKKNLTGAIGSIRKDDIEDMTTANATQALAGRVAGVRVEANGGDPGAGVNVIIRGTGTLTNVEPLYVIDGVFSERMDFLNPSDIASVDILKDASTAAIYGARAGQGVVIITTKKGVKGQAMKVALHAKYGIQNAVRTIDYLNAREYANNRNQAAKNDGIPTAPANDAQFDPSVDSDIQKESLRAAAIQNYGVRFYGGGMYSTYTISGNWLSQEGIVKYSDFQRFSVRINSSLEKKKLNITESLFLTRSVNRPNYYFDREYGHIPTAKIYDATRDGGYTAGLTEFHGIGRSANWLGVAALSDRNIRIDNILGSLNAEYEIIKGLSYSLRLSLNYKNTKYFLFIPTYDISDSDVGRHLIAELFETRSTFLSTIVENLLTYDKQLGNHIFSVLAGYSRQSDLLDDQGVSVSDFPNNDLRTIGAGNEIKSVRGEKLPRKIGSVFGRFNYSYKDTYLISASLRRDGSSNFGKNNRYGIFPSIALGWNIANEDFFNRSAIGKLKIRVSYGKLGSDNLSPFLYLSTLNINSSAVFGAGQKRFSGISQTVFANPDLKWEQTITKNIGIDIGLHFGRLNCSIDYYQKRSKDILASLIIPPTSGTSTPVLKNAATIDNKGLEFSINFSNDDSRNALHYSITANAAFLHNEVIDLGEGVTPIVGGSFSDETIFATLTKPGYPVASFYGFVTDGVYKNQAEIDADGIKNRNLVPGDLRFTDLDNNKIIDERDKTFLGSPIPDFEYGATIDVDFKGMDIKLFFNGVAGNELWNGRRLTGVFDPNGNKLGIVRDAWTTENTDTNIPRPTISDPARNRLASDFYVESGAYFALKNMTIGYRFSPSLAKIFESLKARIYIDMENVFVIDQYSGYYPEVGRNRRRGNALFTRGVDRAQYPTARTISVGVQLTF